MTKQELLTKADEALAACLDKVKKKAEGDEANNAKAFAEAADTMERVRFRLSGREEDQ